MKSLLRWLRSLLSPYTLPRPTTFAEGQRAAMVWMLLGAGMVTTLLAFVALFIVWRGGWPAGTEEQRLTIIGWALLGALAGMGAVIVSLAIGGPVGRFSGSAFGASFEAEGDRAEAAAHHVAHAAVEAAEDVTGERP